MKESTAKKPHRNGVRPQCDVTWMHPVQLFGRNKADLTPEELLMIAMLEQARDDIMLSARSDELRADAIEYLMAEYDPENPLSFERICEHFEWDSARVREKIKNGGRGRGGWNDGTRESASSSTQIE